jgi:hypothetical protein
MSENNFCPRCGKRNAGDLLHTYTPPDAPVSATNDSCTLGVGNGSGKLFVHGDYESIKACQALLAATHPVPAVHAQEPVAWQSQQKDTGEWLDPITIPYSDIWRKAYKVRPLYTEPTDAQAIRDQAMQDCVDKIFAACWQGTDDFNKGFECGMREAVEVIRAMIGKPTGSGE